MRKLSSDQLGELGESHFRKICALTNLICNSAHRDRAGWDFLVKFPFESFSEEYSLDLRPGPISCYVQVKATYAIGKKIRLNLSSAEYIAKEHMPAFIYVVYFNSSSEVVENYLIHLMGKNIEKILSRLREAQSNKCKKISNIYVTFSPKEDGVRLRECGSDLKEKINSFCNFRMDEYVSEKIREIKQIGFNESRLNLKVTFNVDDEEELINVLLGKKQASCVIREANETRFGIPLPMNEIPVGKPMDFIARPLPFDTCKIIIMDNAGGDPAILDGDAIVPPSCLSAAEYCVVLRSEFFDIDILSSKIKIEVQQSVFSVGKFCVDKWLNFFRALKILASGSASIGVKPSKLQKFQIPLNLQFNADKILQYKTITLLLECAYSVLKAAGLFDLNLTFRSIIENSEGFVVAYHLISCDISGIPSFPCNIDCNEEIDFVYVDNFEVLDTIIVYGAKVRLKVGYHNGEKIFIPSKIDAPSITSLSRDPVEYKGFIRLLQKQSGVNNLIVRQFEGAVHVV